MSHLSDFKIRVSTLRNNEEIFYGFPRDKKRHKPKCDSHQCRIPVIAKNKVIQKLGGKSKLYPIPSSIKNFEDLYANINNLIGSIHGIGTLCVYDIAVRLGVKNGIYPQDFVYLHAGPMESAKHLHKNGKIVLPKNCSPCVPISVFSKFSSEDAFGIEVDLCIKKKAILNIDRTYKGTLDTL